ncbi:DUF1700 domain-containing protein [Liquorilactobacillus capillatus]|uniref:Membrane protein n=1 Tax=Liquorilactobacillus capillatus DSM 19910 TaxID=1423731 RepID=A0A0R1M637_9LACO|nr:DUF1700 domain-containing protein [Liquorilactobacillus capillatus]KRL03564.1 membrane protein [Liquorilactobacillus capillatus DSM 19910]
MEEDKKVYFVELERYLSPLTAEETNDVIDFYSEYVEDAGLQTKTELENKLGTAKQLSRKILADHSIKIDEDQRHHNIKRSPRSNSKMIWIIILAIISAPMTLGIGGILLILLMSMILTAIIIVVAMLLTLVILTAVCLYTGLLMLFTEFTVGIFYLGCGIAALGGLMIAMPLLYWVCSAILQVVANFARYLYQRFSRKRQGRSEA